ALVVAGAACLTAARAGVRWAGVISLAAAAAWGVDEALALARTQAWSAGRLLSFAAALGLAGVTALIARELWPQRPRRALAAAAIVLAYPVTYRYGVLF